VSIIGVCGHDIKKIQGQVSRAQGLSQEDVLTEPSGEHFNKPGHGVHHMRGLVLEKVCSKDPYILKAREHKYIQKLDSFRNGLKKEA
jgi:hypothetical protein